ncbi:SSI family serine proteinase inhibitor [Nonomuraea antri]|uniref:SSI family serine proteinase inhibitor n=1 Tax=Nonomuraea antri TaxID=2730852 RepID=UPI001EEC37CB|nr:SSI family serine proteinase inhibitor [Nonomuraea antri]
MMRLPLLITSAALGAGLVLTAIPAQAAARPNGVFLAISANGNDTLKAVGIQCPGRIEQHPFGEAACGAIDAVDGDFDRLPVSPRPCSKKRDPVTATMNGLWRGRIIGWQKTFANACLLAAKTGPIFAFDRILFDFS